MPEKLRSSLKKTFKLLQWMHICSYYLSSLWLLKVSLICRFLIIILVGTEAHRVKYEGKQKNSLVLTNICNFRLNCAAIIVKSIRMSLTLSGTHRLANNDVMADVWHLEKAIAHLHTKLWVGERRCIISCCQSALKNHKSFRSLKFKADNALERYNMWMFLGGFWEHQFKPIPRCCLFKC